MDKRLASNTIKFLDKVSTQGHVEREAMNEICVFLLGVVNAEDPLPASKESLCEED